MTTFHDVQFPQAIAEGAQGGPQFLTAINVMASGYEQRNIEWSRTRAKFDISYGIKTRTDAQVVVDFFYARYGRAYGFRFKDWADYEVGTSTAPMTIGVGDNTNHLFQALKPYSSGGYTFNRRLTRLVAGTVKVYLAGILKATPADYSVSASGLITFVTAPGVGIGVGLWAQFDVPVRFDTDYLDTSVLRPDVMEVSSITLVELRE